MADNHKDLTNRLEKLEEEKRLREQSERFHEAEEKEAAVQWTTWD